MAAIPDFIEYYDKELLAAKAETSIKGSVERSLAELPGITQWRFGQLQEIEAVLEYLNIQLRKIKQKHYKKYLEGYNRALTSRDAERYADAEDEVLDYEVLINEVALTRNKYLAIMKGLDQKSFMIGHLTRLKLGGMEDFSL